jgi:hypothetical protein
VTVVNTMQLSNNRTVLLVSRLLLSLALVLSAGACGGGSPVTDSAGGEASADSGYDTADPGSSGDEGDEPVPEGTGPERPAPPQAERASIRAPSLPIGTNDNSTDRKDEPHCVKLSWSGSGDIPSDFSVVVTDVQLSSSTYFRKGTTGCPAPSCESYAFRENSGPCYATVIPLAYQNDDGTPSVELSLVGRVECPMEKRQECQKYADGLAGQETHVNIYAPPPPDDNPLPVPEPDRSSSADPQQSPIVETDQSSLSQT